MTKSVASDEHHLAAVRVAPVAEEIVVPLLAVFLPLFRFLPQIVSWRVRRLIYRWYGQLIVLEHDVQAREGALPVARWLSDLDRIERASSTSRPRRVSRARCTHCANTFISSAAPCSPSRPPRIRA